MGEVQLSSHHSVTNDIMEVEEAYSYRKGFERSSVCGSWFCVLVAYWRMVWGVCSRIKIQDDGLSWSDVVRHKSVHPYVYKRL